MTNKIEAGMKVQGIKDDALVIGVVVMLNKGWATLDVGDKQVKMRVTELEEFEDDKKEVAPAASMSKKLAAARKQYVHEGKTFHNGDPIARALHGMDLHTVAVVGAKLLDTTSTELLQKYEHLNAGQKRMNIGNRIRRAIKENPELLADLERISGKAV